MPQQRQRKSAEELLGIAPAGRKSAEELLGIAPSQPKPAAQVVLPQDRQEFGKRLPSLDESLNQSARYNRGKTAPSRVNWGTGEFLPGETVRQQREAFAQKPLLEQWKERGYDALARSGGGMLRQARQVGGFLGSKMLNPYAPSMSIPETQFEKERNAELQARQQGRPSSLATDVAEGIIEAAPQVGLAGLLTAAGIPAPVVGGGMAATGADWQNPAKAATQTAIGTLAPVIGGKIGSKVGGAVANRLSQPIAQTAARAGGELAGGGLGNVIGTGAEQLAFEGQLNPRELIKQGAIGAALNVPGAISAGRGSATPPTREIRYNPRTPEGAIRAPESPVAGRRLLPPAPEQPIEASPTRPFLALRPADAPVTQEMPEISARIAAESAPTTEQPILPRGVAQEPTNRITEGEGGELQRYSRSLEGQPVEIPSRGPRESGLLQASRPGQAVTEQSQLPPGPKKAETFISREDARQGHFERFNDEELVDEIRRMEEIRNQDIRGKSKLTPEQLEANRFDLKTAVEQQKERRRLQQQIGIEPGERIAPRTPSRPARKIQHSTLGEVVEAENQKGIPPGKLRVVAEATGKESVIQNPRTRGNRQAAFVKSTGAIPAAAMPEMAGKTETPIQAKGRQSYAIPDKAMPEMQQRSRGHVMGMGLGGLQGLFERGGKAKAATPPPGQQELFETAPKRSLAKRAASNAVSAVTLPRALMASGDLSAPLRQGAILTLPPTQWGRAAKSGVRMLQAISTRQYDRLAGEMNNHPDAKVGKDAGLYMATDPTKGAGLRGREEDFISKWAEKIPIVKHGEQAYKTYLDSIRLETFRKYKRVIDGNKKLSFEDRQNAYKAAADWINVASGRGSLGKTLDKAMPALSAVFFAPRYTASRVQVLNPATYLKNSTTAAGRAVLKQQMTDLVQFAGVVSATLALAKAGGAEVGTDPDDADFLKIKVGNVRYDTLAGLQQIMRLFYRVGKDTSLAAVGKKSEQGEGAIDVAGRFARSKLAPAPSFFVDALSRKDFIGRDFEMGRGIKERVFPLMWKDFYDAYQREGLGAAAKLTPGVLGVGVQDFAKKPGVLTQRNQAYMGELERLGVKPGESARRLENELENLYKERAGRIESWRDQYGAQLIQHPMYQKLNNEQRKAAIESLHSRIGEQANQRNPNPRAFNPAAIVRGVRESERTRRKTDRDKIYVAPR